MTAPTVPATFDDYMAKLNITADHGNLDGWRKVYEHELYAEAHAPAVIPACPSWCVDPDGHDYDSTDGAGEQLTFHRFHHAPVGPLLSVDALEHNHDGTVTMDAPSVHLDERPEVGASGARALAADLLAAADLLDSITGR